MNSLIYTKTLCTKFITIQTEATIHARPGVITEIVEARNEVLSAVRFPINFPCLSHVDNRVFSGDEPDSGSAQPDE